MKKFPFLSLALCVLFFCPSCNKDKGDSAAAGDKTQKRLRLAFVTNTTNEFWAITRHGCRSAAQKLGNVDVDFRFFTGSTVAAQQEILNDLLNKGVDGIAISPIDAEKQTDFLNQVAAKTLLVCVDSDAINSKRVCFIGTDNVAAGKQAAELLKAALPQGGKVVLFVGYPNAQNAKDRIQGIQSELAGANIEILETMSDATKIEVARKNAQDALAKYPDLSAVVGLYSYNGPALLNAVRGAGKAGKVKIVCFDDDTETLAGVASGEIYGTVVQIPTRIGYETISRMDKYLGGDKTQLPPGNVLFSSLPVKQGMAESMQFYRQNLLQP
jgi:ribose transport system substrate-binding protein